MRRQGLVLATLGLAMLVAIGASVSAQLPMSALSRTGRTVTPVFEGWYPNPDGTFSISFGYYNRNTEEAVEVPIGPDNAIQPGTQNQGQPTHFEPGRHWGVFAVKVPANFGGKEVTWTLKVRGEAASIPGFLRANWQVDALEGEAGSGNTPPWLKFDDTGPEGHGPLGITVGPRTVSVGAPLTLTVWSRDDGKASGGVTTAGRQAVPVTLTWFKHQGPGAVVFSPPTARIPTTGGSATTSVTFSEPENTSFACGPTMRQAWPVPVTPSAAGATVS